MTIEHLTLGIPGPADYREWKDRLADWADRLGEIPRMSRAQIYAIFGKARKTRTPVYSGGCDCEDECDCPPPRRRSVIAWTHGVKPHSDIRVLRRRAMVEHLRLIPRRPYRYAGIDIRRPPRAIYVDGEQSPRGTPDPVRSGT